MPVYPGAQWVLSVPKRLRPCLHHNPELAGAVLGIFLRAIRTTLRHTSPGASPDAQLGAVSFLHRFGSSLNPQFFELRSKVSRMGWPMRFAPRPLGRSAPFPPRRPRQRLRAGLRRHRALPRGRPAHPRRLARPPAPRPAPHPAPLPHPGSARGTRRRRQVLILGGGNVSDGSQEAMVVEPPDPLQRRELDVFHVPPRPHPSDDFCLEQADDGFGRSIVVRVSDTAHRGFDPCLGQALRAPNAQVLPRFKGSSQRIRIGGRLGSPLSWMVRE